MIKTIFLKILLSFVLLSVFANSERYDQTTKTINFLFNEERYDKRLRPHYQEKVVTVTVGMTIIHIGQIREKDMDYSLDIFFYQSWYDKRLNHSLPYPIHLSGTKNLIWLPDTFFLNIKTAKTHNVPTDNTKIIVSKNGLVLYSTRLTLTAGCEMNLMDYPLDTQTCNLTILSYSYTVDDLDYEWTGNSDKAIDIVNKAMNEFYLTDIKLQKERFAYSVGNWTHLNIMFTFKRRVGYSLLQVYVPLLLIVTLSWLSFWISKDAAPARIALGITTVLTIVTLMGSLRSEFPKVSYVKAVDLFFIVSFLFVFGAVMEYILVLLKCAMEEKAEKEREERQGHLAQTMKNEYMKTSKVNECQEFENSVEKLPVEEENKVAFQSGLDDASPSENQETKRRKGIPRRTIHKTKKIVRFVLLEQNAHVVDRVSRVAFPLVYLIFNIVYWIYYSLNEFD